MDCNESNYNSILHMNLNIFNAPAGAFARYWKFKKLMVVRVVVVVLVSSILFFFSHLKFVLVRGAMMHDDSTMKDNIECTYYVDCKRSYQ